MPCNSDYMEATSIERKMSEIYYFLTELKTGKQQKIDSYHPDVYCQNLTKKICDAKTKLLCGLLQQISNIPELSLELQMWWRDHQEIDRIKLLSQSEKEKVKLQKFKDWLKKENSLSSLAPVIITALKIGWDERANSLRNYLDALKEDGHSTVNIEHLLKILNIEK